MSQQITINGRESFIRSTSVSQCKYVFLHFIIVAVCGLGAMIQSFSMLLNRNEEYEQHPP